jgi:histidinol dehydrogenase
MIAPIKYKDLNSIAKVLQRPYTDNKAAKRSVQSILEQVKINGDKAISD